MGTSSWSLRVPPAGACPRGDWLPPVRIMGLPLYPVLAPVRLHRRAVLGELGVVLQQGHDVGQEAMLTTGMP